MGGKNQSIPVPSGRVKRLALIASIPLAVIILLTIFGLIFHHVPCLSNAGLLLFTICFAVFTLTDSLLRLANYIIKTLADYRNLLQEYATIKLILSLSEFVAKLPQRLLIIVRGTALSVSFWVVGFYVGLCQSGVHWVPIAAKELSFKTLVTMSLAIIDTSRGKTIRRPGVPTILMTTYGAFSFYKNFSILMAGTLGEIQQRAAVSFFANPLWFNDTWTIGRLYRFTSMNGLVLSAIIFLGIPTFGLIGSFGAMGQESADSKCFGIAGIIFFGYCLSWAVFVIYHIFRR